MQLVSIIGPYLMVLNCFNSSCLTQVIPSNELTVLESSIQYQCPVGNNANLIIQRPSN
jgi:hypothetical protein